MRVIPDSAWSFRHATHGLFVLISLLVVLSGCQPKSGSSRQPGSGSSALITRTLVERGALTYLSRTYSPPGKLGNSSEVSGLVVMRETADMRPLGGRYYDDGFGNLIGFGFFKAPKLGGLSRYALTFRKNGGMQLALDFRDDSVVDVLVELDRDGRFGGLAGPDAQWLLDCMSQEIAGGANIAAAANHCLESVAGGGGGGGGGLGRAAEVEADRLSKPDCKEEGGIPGSVAQEGGGDGDVEIELDNGDTIHASSTTNEDNTSTLSITIVDAQGRVVYTERTTFDSDGNEVSSEIQRVTYDDTGGSHWESERRENGRVVESADRYHGPSLDDVDIEIGGATRVQHWDERARRWRPGVGPTRRPPPGPDCEDCPIDDPRCAPAPNDIASLWDCQAETGMSLWKCLERMQDAIYTATGGRCAVAVGADDRPNIKCSDRRLTECLMSGGSVEDCLRQTGYIGDRESIGPENDDFLRNRFGGSRGRVGLYIDSTPVGAVFLGLCADGMEQFCRGDGRF